MRVSRWSAGTPVSTGAGSSVLPVVTIQIIWNGAHAATFIASVARHMCALLFIVDLKRGPSPPVRTPENVSDQPMPSAFARSSCASVGSSLFGCAIFHFSLPIG